MTVVLSILAIALFYFLLQAYSRWRLFRDREVITLRDMYDKSPLRDMLPYSCFEEVMHQIGKSYRVRPEKLRLDDTFSDRLEKADSWMLGDGAEDMGTYLQKRFPIFEEQDCTTKTIFDLLCLIAQAGKGVPIKHPSPERGDPHYSVLA